MVVLYMDFLSIAAFLGLLLLFVRSYLLNEGEVVPHISTNLSYERKKEIVLDNFGRIPTYTKIRLIKANNNLYKNKSRDTSSANLDLNFLTEVVSFDPSSRVIHVEGLMTYERLADITLEHGLLPLIVPDFKSITVGGSISGLGIESSSFKYGLVPSMMLEYEVLTGEGEIVTASPRENTELFYGLPNSFGSLGYVLSAKVKLTPVKPYLYVTNTSYSSSDEFVTEIQEAIEDSSTDFLDGMITGPGNFHLMRGTMVDEAPYTNQYIQDIYHKSIPERSEDYMEIRDYLWRYDSNAFYMDGVMANPLVRAFLSPALRTSKLKKMKERVGWLLSMGGEDENITNDLQVSLRGFPDFLHWYERNIGVFPVWICPKKNQHKCYFFQSDDELDLDFGIGFGVGKETDKSDLDFYKKRIDQKMYEMKGSKGLYAETFLSREQFWKIYDRERKYGLLKDKYDPEDRFMDLYDKVVNNS